MGRCAAVKRKRSPDQCSANSLLNSEFCGVHSRCRNPTRWAPVHIEQILKIQSVVRRFLVKLKLTRGGPGVLSRKTCMNEEELVTLDEKGSVHPFEYFGWVDNGKTWWMSIVSVLQLFRGELHPTNPYSRTPFPLEARRRIRQIYVHRLRNGLPLAHVRPQDSERLVFRLTTVAQIMEENGHLDFHPETWSAMTPAQIVRFMEILLRIFSGWSLEAPIHPWRVGLTNYIRRSYASAQETPRFALWYSSCATMTCLIQDRLVHDVAFMIASARYQVLEK